MTGVQPIDTYSIMSDGAQTTRQVYPDGSVAITMIQIDGDPTESLLTEWIDNQPEDVLDCTVTSGSGYIVYNGCKVVGSNWLVTMGFTASFGLVNGGYDYISWHGAPYQQCSGAVCGTPYLAGARMSESSVGSAFVDYFMHVNVGGVASRTSSLRLTVGGDTYYSDFLF